MNNTIDFLKNTIEPALNHVVFNIGYSESGLLSARRLLLGTAITESGLVHRVQKGGPALGLYQMEPDTHDDVWNNYLVSRPHLKNVINNLVDRDISLLDNLKYNDIYATAMARLHYLRVPEKLPHPDDIPGMARYWKKYYNTPLGKGEEDTFISKFYNFLGI